MEADAIISLPQAVISEFGPRHWRQFVKDTPAAFLRSELQGFLRPAEMHFHIRLMLRNQNGPIGGMVLSRTARDRDFAEDDLKLL